MNTTIKLNDLLKIDTKELSKFKLHLAAHNGKEQPLDVFSRDFNEWVDWNRWRGGKNDFSREYILSLIPDYHKSDKYIFGGVFQITKRHEDWGDTEIGYDLSIIEQFTPFIGRLEIEFHRYLGMRGRAFYLESFIDDMVVTQILEKPYSGIDFPGYDNVLINFSALEHIVQHQKQDWKVALENMKGIYIIVDRSNGKKYVGSAYGEGGIWARWSSYVYSDGHGYNDELVDVISKNGVQYACDNFQLALLETLSMKSDQDTVIHRESFWKEVLFTRSQFGYNRN